MSDHELMSTLIGQVARAVAPGKSECSVTTLITRPMWREWCRVVGAPEDSVPTEWTGDSTLRVYGSKTVIVESEAMMAVSFAQ